MKKKLVIDKLTVEDYKLGIDYEILSYEVERKDFRIVPFGRFTGKNVLEVENVEVYVEKLNDLPNVSFAYRTGTLSKIHDIYFLEDNMVKIDTAIDCGFGVGRILKGKHKGRFFLYHHFSDEERLSLMLDVYLQLSVPGYDHKGLEKFITTRDGRFFVRLFTNTEDTDLVDRLESVYASKKGGDNIVQFPNH